ncbi:MAG TPA: potassium-transporting ATPase subunit KdpC [Jatrophihabitans sp.]|jgi:K+-transporting ATPase ATPase C chain
MRAILDYLRTASAALRMLLIFTAICGIAYPLAITAVAQIPGLKHRADGSFVTKAGVVVGSSLIGQSFTDAKGNALPQYFQSRPSAAGEGYDATASSASNYGPESTKLLDLVNSRRAAIADLEGVAGSAVPPDALTTSGSGLDPDISPAYAALQERRVAAVRHATVAQIDELVHAHTASRALGFMGEPAVNVLELNLALDATLPVQP